MTCGSRFSSIRHGGSVLGHGDVIVQAKHEEVARSGISALGYPQLHRVNLVRSVHHNRLVDLSLRRWIVRTYVCIDDGRRVVAKDEGPYRDFRFVS